MSATTHNRKTKRQITTGNKSLVEPKQQDQSQQGSETHGSNSSDEVAKNISQKEREDHDMSPKPTESGPNKKEIDKKESSKKMLTPIYVVDTVERISKTPEEKVLSKKLKPLCIIEEEEGTRIVTTFRRGKRNAKKGDSVSTTSVGNKDTHARHQNPEEASTHMSSEHRDKSDNMPKPSPPSGSRNKIDPDGESSGHRHHDQVEDAARTKPHHQDAMHIRNDPVGMNCNELNGVMVSIPKIDQFQKDTGRYTSYHFPTRLYEALDDQEVSGRILEWLPDGYSFNIHRWDELQKVVIPRYFPDLREEDGQAVGTIDAFLYHLGLWGFEEITDGEETGGYRRELFVRGAKKLCEKIHHNDGAFETIDNETIMSSLGWSSCTRIAFVKTPNNPTHGQVAAETCSEFGKAVAKEAASSLFCDILWNIIRTQTEDANDISPKKHKAKKAATRRQPAPSPATQERVIPDVISVDNSLIEVDEPIHPTNQQIDPWKYKSKDHSNEKVEFSKQRNSDSDDKQNQRDAPDAEWNEHPKRIVDNKEKIVQQTKDPIPGGVTTGGDHHQAQSFDTSDQIVTTCVCDIANGHFERKTTKTIASSSSHKASARAKS